jgi:hypothetical protein
MMGAREIKHRGNINGGNIIGGNINGGWTRFEVAKQFAVHLVADLAGEISEAKLCGRGGHVVSGRVVEY